MDSCDGVVNDVVVKGVVNDVVVKGVVIGVVNGFVV